MAAPLRQDVAEVIKLRSHPAVKEPEWRTLDQIVAEARAAGRPVVVLGPAGIFEIAAVGATHASPGEVTQNGTADECR